MDELGGVGFTFKFAMLTDGAMTSYQNTCDPRVFLLPFVVLVVVVVVVGSVWVTRKSESSDVILYFTRFPPR